jgi:hypothetical protein
MEPERGGEPAGTQAVFRRESGAGIAVTISAIPVEIAIKLAQPRRPNSVLEGKQATRDEEAFLGGKKQLARKLLNAIFIESIETMSNHASAAHSPVARRGRRSKTSQKRGRPHKQSASSSVTNGERDYAAVGTLTRTKALLLAALRVWELKHRIND